MQKSLAQQVVALAEKLMMKSPPEGFTAGEVRAWFKPRRAQLAGIVEDALAAAAEASPRKRLAGGIVHFFQRDESKPGVIGRVLDEQDGALTLFAPIDGAPERRVVLRLADGIVTERPDLVESDLSAWNTQLAAQHARERGAAAKPETRPKPRRDKGHDESDPDERGLYRAHQLEAAAEEAEHRELRARMRARARAMGQAPIGDPSKLTPGESVLFWDYNFEAGKTEEWIPREPRKFRSLFRDSMGHVSLRTPGELIGYPLEQYTVPVGHPAAAVPKAKQAEDADAAPPRQGKRAFVRQVADDKLVMGTYDLVKTSRDDVMTANTDAVTRTARTEHLKTGDSKFKAVREPGASRYEITIRTEPHRLAEMMGHARDALREKGYTLVPGPGAEAQPDPHVPLTPERLAAVASLTPNGEKPSAMDAAVAILGMAGWGPPETRDVGMARWSSRARPDADVETIRSAAEALGERMRTTLGLRVAVEEEGDWIILTVRTGKAAALEALRRAARQLALNPSGSALAARGYAADAAKDAGATDDELAAAIGEPENEG